MKYFLLAVSLLTVVSCKYKTNSIAYNPLVEEFKCEFDKFINEFPDSLTKHFPLDVAKNLIAYNSSYKDDPKEIMYFTVLSALTTEEKFKYSNKLETADTCLFKIYLNRNTYGFDKKEIGNCDKYFPVPDYNIISRQPMASDIKYHIIEASNDTFFNHRLYLRSYLPVEWKNGMTRGVGISEENNTIFYWLMMW